MSGDLDWLADLGKMGLGAGAVVAVHMAVLRTKLSSMADTLDRVEKRLNGTVERVHGLDKRVAVLEVRSEAPQKAG